MKLDFKDFTLFRTSKVSLKTNEEQSHTTSRSLKLF